MRDIKNKLTSGKNTKNIKSKKGKSFGYQILGFGSGGVQTSPVDFEYLIIAGGGNGVYGAGGGAGGFRTTFPGGSAITLAAGPHTITIGGSQTDSSIPSVPLASSGGGRGGIYYVDNGIGGPGGSGGGAIATSAGTERAGGDGNIGSYSPAEGTDGGPATDPSSPGQAVGGGGGGHSAAGGSQGSPSNISGNGGNGTANSITGAPVTRAGGG